MREMNLTELLPDIVLRFKREQKSAVPVFLTLPDRLPSFRWTDNSLEGLILTIIDHAVSISYPGKPVRVSVSKRTGMFDIEMMLKTHPLYWIQLKMDVQSPSGLEASAQETLEQLGFRCEDEWTTENSERRLITYSRANQPVPALLLWMQDHKANHKYIFLIPITNPSTDIS